MGRIGPKLGLSQQRPKVYNKYKVASNAPGINAPRNKSNVETSRTGPITISIIDGGIRIPNVPPAVIVPAAS